MSRLRMLLICVVVAAVSGCATVSEREAVEAAMHRRLAEAKLQLGQHALAVREYRAALALNPKDPETHFGLAESYRRKGMQVEAERHFLETLRLDPQHHDARLNLGVVYLQQERWADAVRECSTLFDDPTFLRPSRALVNRGWAHYRLGDLESAERDLREALVSDGGSFRAHLNLGVLLWGEGEVLDAMVHLERVLEILQRRPPAAFAGVEAQARFHLASAHIKLGQRDKALLHLRRAAELGGDSEWGEKSRDALGLIE